VHDFLCKNTILKLIFCFNEDVKIDSGAKTTFHRPKATKEMKDMELRQWSDKLLFLQLLRRFHVPAQKYSRIPNHQPERWNVVTTGIFETSSFEIYLTLRCNVLLI